MAKIFSEFNEQKIKEVREHPYFENIRNKIIKKAEENLVTEPPRVKFSMIHEYVVNGNRERFQNVYENYQFRLQNLFLAYIITDDEKYVEPISDIIWNIMDFESWTIPAHVDEKLDLERRRCQLDLTSTIMGSRIAEVLDYMGDKLPELVRRRAISQVRERVIDSYAKYNFWWETATNNWSAVCIASVIVCYAYLATKEEFESQLSRMLSSMNAYLDGFDDEGCCTEGYGYWNYGFSYFCKGASILRDYTDGEINYFKNPKVLSIARFQENIAINEKETICFSDCGSKFSPSIWLSHFIKNEYPELAIPSFKTADAVATSSLRYVFWIRPELAECGMELKNHIYHNAQWFIYRSGPYNFACKAGHNAEPHNHNDVGSFILSKNGKVTLTDAGIGEYTKQYFSKQRYEYFVTSSRGHSVPIINGEYQVSKNDKSVITSCGDNEYGFSMDNAYEIESLKYLNRHFKMLDSGVAMTDTYEFSEKPESVTERFISLIQPEVCENGVKIGETLLVYDKDVFDAQISANEVSRPGSLIETVYATDLKVKSPECAMTLEFKFI